MRRAEVILLMGFMLGLGIAVGYTLRPNPMAGRIWVEFDSLGAEMAEAKPGWRVYIGDGHYPAFRVAP